MRMDRSPRARRASPRCGGRCREPGRGRRTRKKESRITPRRWRPPAKARFPGASRGWRDWLDWGRGAARREGAQAPVWEEAPRIPARTRRSGSSRPARSAPPAPCTLSEAVGAPEARARAALRTRTGRLSPPGDSPALPGSGGTGGRVRLSRHCSSATGGCAPESTKASWRVRTASSVYFSSITTEILISLVLIIWMLIPSLARTWNIFAATPA